MDSFSIRTICVSRLFYRRDDSSHLRLFHPDHVSPAELQLSAHRAVRRLFRRGARRAHDRRLGLHRYGLLGLGVFFPGFLLTDFLTGFLFGWVLHGHPLTVKRTAAAFFLVAVVVNLGLQTLWLTLFYGKAWGAIFLPRLVKNILWPPVQVMIFCAVYRALRPAASALLSGKDGRR